MIAHPLTAKVPNTSPSDYAAMREGIRTKGQIYPIIIKDGMIWDGRNREAICQELGIEARYEEYTGPLTAAEYILQAALRRNLTDGQRDAMIIALAKDVVPQLRKEAKEAQKTGSAKGGATPRLKVSPNREEPSERSGDTQKRFRKIVGSCKKADQAIAVINHEDLATKVENGEISLRAAAQEAVTRNNAARNKAKKTDTVSSKLTDAQKEDLALLERIKQPSVFPEGVTLPPPGDPLRWCIDELRAHQADIHKMGDTNLWNKIRQHTNALVRKKELDPKLIAWVEDIIERHNKQTIRLINKDREKPDHPYVSKELNAKTVKVKSFEDYFESYWTQEEKLLDKFPVKHFKRLIKQWSKDAREFLRQKLASVSTASSVDLPHGQNGAGNSQQAVTSMDEAPATLARKEQKSYGKE